MSAQPAQLSIDTAFDRALTGANARERPPVPVGAVRFGQPSCATARRTSC